MFSTARAGSGGGGSRDPSAGKLAAGASMSARSWLAIELTVFLVSGRGALVDGGGVFVNRRPPKWVALYDIVSVVYRRVAICVAKFRRYVHIVISSDMPMSGIHV